MNILFSDTVDFIHRLFYFIENGFSPLKTKQKDIFVDNSILDDFEQNVYLDKLKEDGSLKKLNFEENISQNILPRRRILPPEHSPTKDTGKIPPLIRSREAYHRESRRNRFLRSTGSRSRSPFRFCFTYMYY